MFGIGPTELLILLVIAAIPVGVLVGVALLVWLLARSRREVDNRQDVEGFKNAPKDSR